MGKRLAWGLAAGTTLLVAGTTTTTTSTSTSTTTTTSSTSTTTTTSPTTTTTTTSTATTLPTGYTAVLARNFGVMCDGITDDTAALQNALNLIQSYQALELPAGTCKTTATELLAYKSNVVVLGAGMGQTIISASDPAHSAFIVYQGNGITLQDFQVYSPNATQRLDPGDARGVYVTTSQNVTLNRMEVRNTAGAGVAYWNVTGGAILNSDAEKTWADSFHITGNTSNITVQYNIAHNAGDDSFSSIGYSGENLHDISILDNASYDGWWGSCVGVEGTTTAHVQRNKCYRSGAAGIRVQSWTSYPTNPEDGIDISYNYIEGAVTRPELIDAHGAITVVTNYNYLHNISMTGNTIVNPMSHSGVLAFGLDATHNVTGSATNNVMQNTTGKLTTPFSIGAYAVITRSGNTLNGNAI